jgi:hypothetical protein
VLGALLAAPLVAAVLEIAIFSVGVLLAGRSPELFSVAGLAYTYVGFALPFIPIGALFVLFRRGSPLDPPLSSVLGAVCGALTSSIAVLILSYPDDYSWGTHIDRPLSIAIIVGLGLAGGVIGGLAFWQICRLGMRKPDD